MGAFFVFGCFSPLAPITINPFHRPCQSHSTAAPKTTQTNLKVTDSTLKHTLLGEGCRVLGSRLASCVLGPNSFVDRGCDLEVCL